MSAPTAYHHLLFARHEVIWANGAAAESFHPGQAGLESFAPAQRREIAAHGGAPELYGPTARRVLKRDEAKLLMALVGAEPVALRRLRTKIEAA